MRRDFRVKTDISRIYKDARQNSWVYIDSSKILYVSQLAEHVRKLFDIKKPFHLLSRSDETYFFLPFEEDVRILENNDTVVVVPGTGITSSLVVEKSERHNETSQQSLNQISHQTHQASNEVQNGFLIPPTLFQEKVSNASSDKSCNSEKSSAQNNLMQTIENTSGISFTGSLYRTALHETIADDTKDSKITEDITEDNSITEDSMVSNKRKRVRKRKQRKPTEIVPESDTSLMETSGKKPKIIDSILISSGKHIRFQGLDDEDTASDNNVNNIQNGDTKHKQSVNKDLAALLNLRQSSTPLTFQHKRIKRDYIPETINETSMSVDTSTNINKSHANSMSSSKSMIEPERIKENSMSNKSAADDTVSFKVFRMAEDYTPQLSSVIIAKVLAKSSDESQYTMKILHGREQLQDPEGKFSLPKDEKDKDDEENDVVVLEKSTLLELAKVSAIGTA
ncbi:uncharacterized protein LOC100679130 [Nasonia vitripennis]|uniref:Coilin N-terminal domain-containing protein n=1 Tax=Nasonia vitripennis TaxID=7425 RepID=A0A7M7GFI2_NASVI|nr:uncharacterized protein LOC100679130 [Nasonia vitripennis]